MSKSLEKYNAYNEIDLKWSATLSDTFTSN